MESESLIYYGVYIPNIELKNGEDYVFCNKEDALKEVKNFKKARFKAFQNYNEALEFALHGVEFPNNNLEFKKPEITHTVGDRLCLFRGPKFQDLVKFRKIIESDDYDSVREIIWENPRYLISNGDTPCILQEGFRYNALHVAAKTKSARICELILSTVGSPDFVQLLYGEENRINSEESSKILLDLYLNTPDKGMNETPLHFASKFGAAEVVEVLISYPQCDKNVLNKYSHTPKDIICSRMANPPHELVNKIEALMEDQYYVPVLRSEDNCTQPIIGEAFSPTSPPKLKTSVLEPRLEIHAYAGPMKKEEASAFRKKWKTPPRIYIHPSNSNPDTSSTFRTPVKILKESDIRIQDTEKGLERIGRDLAKEFNVGWKEYWPFLDTFVDLTSEEGLKCLEQYLQNKSFLTHILNNSPLEHKITEETESKNNSTENIPSTVSPISDLCVSFNACNLNDNNSKISTNNIQRSYPISLPYKSTYVMDCITKATAPCICIEKACQVIAHRIALQIVNHYDSTLDHTVENLCTEIKHLKTLVANFMEDPSFTDVVNFQAVHSRIAYVIAQKLKAKLTYLGEMDEIIGYLVSILQKCDKTADLFSSDDEEIGSHNQLTGRKSTSDNKQIICLIKRILISFDCKSKNNFVNVDNIEDCKKAWAFAAVCSCIWKANKSSRKGIYVKKNPSTKYSSNLLPLVNQYSSMENVSRKLNFHDGVLEHDKGDSYTDSEELNKSEEKKSSSENSKCGANNLSSSENLNKSDDLKVSLLEDLSNPSVEYYSANSSLASSDTESEEEPFVDCREDLCLFIEGSSPTKTDFVVYTAIKDIDIMSNEYPHIYKWRHAISTFPEEERVYWPTPNYRLHQLNIGKKRADTLSPSPSTKKNCLTPKNSWIHITGQYSPQRSVKARLSYREN